LFDSIQKNDRVLTPHVFEHCEWLYNLANRRHFWIDRQDKAFSKLPEKKWKSKYL